MVGMRVGVGVAVGRGVGVAVSVGVGVCVQVGEGWLVFVGAAVGVAGAWAGAQAVRRRISMLNVNRTLAFMVFFLLCEEMNSSNCNFIGRLPFPCRQKEAYRPSPTIWYPG